MGAKSLKSEVSMQAMDLAETSNEHVRAFPLALSAVAFAKGDRQVVLAVASPGDVENRTKGAAGRTNCVVRGRHRGIFSHHTS